MDRAIVTVSQQQQKDIIVHLNGGGTLEGKVIYHDEKMFALNFNEKFQCVYFRSVETFEIKSEEAFCQVCEIAKEAEKAKKTYNALKT